jgi:hypothetical protein
MLKKANHEYTGMASPTKQEKSLAPPFSAFFFFPTFFPEI